MKVGIDLVDIKRFENKPQNFFEKIFTKAEITYCTSYKNPSPNFAGHFAAKEAVMKALGHGLEEISFLDIEIFHEQTSAPKVKLSGNAQKFAEELGLKNFEISISHDGGFATAICIAN
ncbi:MAG: holo-ACP synthase [Clostridia bacterium]|nr:holo-ACP synthase [Clostridia bacterium]